MLRVEFYLLDIDAVEGMGGKIVIRLFGRTPDGKRVCAIDDRFVPYFYVVPTAPHHVKHLVNLLEGKKYRVQERLAYVTETAMETKHLLGKAITAIKVKVNHPKDIPIIADRVKMLPEVQDVYETDILFTKRYLIDNRLMPLMSCYVEGEETDANVSTDITLKIARVSPVEGTFIKNPRILAIDIEAHGKQKQPDAAKDPVLMIAFYGLDGFNKVLTWKTFSTPKKYIEFVQDEGALLLRFKEVVQAYRPDYLVGYYSDGFDLPYLRARADVYNIVLSLGMDKKNIKVTGAGVLQSAKIKGIVHIDVYKFVKRIMKQSLGVQDYDLNTISKALLGEGKQEENIKRLADAWDTDPERLKSFCEYNLQDARLAFKLVNVLMPHLNEITKMIGMPLYDISRMTYGQLVEHYLLTHVQQFRELVPVKPKQEELATRKKASYVGGFVYEPQPGVYDNVVVFDFKSLYPSIITAHNICPSTLTERQEDAHKAPSITLHGETKQYFFNYKQDGFLPQLVKEIIERRNRIKTMTKEGERVDPLLQAREHTLKLLLNSFYGYLAYSGARWYSLACAAAISAYGRDYMQKVIARAEKEGFRTIYGDTDSIFIALQKDKMEKDALALLRDINHLLPSLMELEYDGFYSKGLFVTKKADSRGAKKKYALLDTQGRIKIIGFESVRGDWSVLAREVQDKLLQIILQEGSKEKALTYIKSVINELNQKNIPLQKLVIKKQLKKELQAYENIGPHVAVAKQLQQQGIQVPAGSMVSFVICSGEGSISERAKPPEQCQEYDVAYYINNQIVPVAGKILEALGYPAKTVLDEEQSTVGDF